MRSPSKRALFYLEPVTYTNNPLRLSGWWNFFSDFAKRSRDYFTSAIAAAPILCSMNDSGFSDKYPIDEISILRRSGFHRPSYSYDLCQGYGYHNKSLLTVLDNIQNDFDPDIIISVTDNRYLKKVFRRSKVMFTELGPFPRFGIKNTMYIDPYGHQVDSALDRFAKVDWQGRMSPDFAHIWQKRWVEPVEEAGRSLGIASWLEDVRQDKKIMLVALQPSDWITYEGIGPILDSISLLRRLADTLGSEWLLVPQWHGSDLAPSDDLMADLSRAQPNIAHVPSGFRIARSEFLVNGVDGVSTISSNVAALAILSGKNINLLGKSKFQKMARSRLTTAKRSDLLAFLSNRYCHDLDRFLNEDGAFAEHILRLERDPSFLFDPGGINPSMLEMLFLA